MYECMSMYIYMSFYFIYVLCIYIGVKTRGGPCQAGLSTHQNTRELDLGTDFVVKLWDSLGGTAVPTGICKDGNEDRP